ncbi:putative serine esterase-domain-containing protein [Lasiosphaeria miniovina]|uniref:Serine esterase-domain-containing protein n=1 Tax=Lasiosphaeria miniovina TaxID=1954250 RepID=A0AA40E8Z9_9PEZI|nr:putative serine esterase-domain-containing protein [Lasiosphaeria miniovina]KAK0728421.1 putative serine esterase-domain-containing protein [Lasiosphaeria miniovina]
MTTAADYSGGTAEADHLCVLVHGLWGNPNHLTYVAKTLREKHPRDKVHILVAKRNSGSFTYDGIELGGERVCREIEEELQLIERAGGKIKKLSFVGYSLGGLVARYAIGLLFARGLLDKFECMNFTAFASPFLGVHTPRRGFGNRLFNVLGARTLAMSGRQLFGIDTFRDTGKPLLAVLADPTSIFMSGLALFRRHTLYANATNDRSAPYFTTMIAKTDPYTDMSKIRVNFVSGYENVVLDPLDPVASPSSEDGESGGQSKKKASLAARLRERLEQLGIVLALGVFVPIFLVAFFTNSGYQTLSSARRIRLHEQGRAGINTETYRVDLWMKEIRSAVEGAYENLNSAQGQEYLRASSSSSSSSSSSENGDAILSSDELLPPPPPSSSQSATKAESEDGKQRGTAGRDILALERRQSLPTQPTLALALYQFEAIKALDALGWRKYPVWIHKHRQSHAAIIVRKDKDSWSEGKIVLRHWVDEEFLL